MSDQLTAVQQHASSVDLVLSNDYQAYTTIYSHAQQLYKQEDGAWQLANKIKDLYESAVCSILDKQPHDYLPTLLLREVALGWGIEPYLFMARVFIEEMRLQNSQEVK